MVELYYIECECVRNMIALQQLSTCSGLLGISIDNIERVF